MPARPYLHYRRLQAGLEGVLLAIMKAVNAHRDHIPPVTSSSTIPFPYDISVAAVGSKAPGGFGLKAVKRMLLHTSPPPMLS